MKSKAAYIEKVTTFNRYHGSTCDLITLKYGRIVAISDEYVGFYDSLEAFEYDCGDDCLAGFWIPKAKE